MAKSKAQSLWLQGKNGVPVHLRLASRTPVRITLSPRFDDYPYFHEAYEQYEEMPRAARHAQVPVHWVQTTKLFERFVIDDEDERERTIAFIQDVKSDMLAGRDIPPVIISKGKLVDGKHRVAAAWEARFKYVPVVDEADLKKAGKAKPREGNPVDGESLALPAAPAAPPPQSGATGAFKLAAGVAVVGLIGAAIYKFFSKDTGTLVADTSKPPTKPAEPEKPLVGSKILAKLPTFNPAATGTVPYYVVNVFSIDDVQLARPERGEAGPAPVDVTWYLRNVPLQDIQVYGPYMPGQKPDRFEGPLPTIALIVAPNGTIITSMDKADLEAISPPPAAPSV